MEAAERRAALLKRLCKRRYDTISNLAVEFGVSERTIRRDIEIISLHEPIYTQSGRYGGGVYVIEQYYIDHVYFHASEEEVLKKLVMYAEERSPCELTSDEIKVLKKLIDNHTKPKTTPKETENAI